MSSETRKRTLGFAPGAAAGAGEMLALARPRARSRIRREEGGGRGGARPRTVRGQLEAAGPGRGIEAGAGRVDGLAADAVRFLGLRDPAAVEVVIEVVVDVLLVVAGAVILRRAHVEDVVPGNCVLDDAVAAE